MESKISEEPSEPHVVSASRLAGVRAVWSKVMKGTVFSSIFTLLTTCIGAGTLSLPYAFSQVAD